MFFHKALRELMSIFHRIPAVAVLVASLFVCVAPRSAAQDAEARHEMVLEHLKRRAAALSSDCLADIKILDDWKRERPRMKRQLLDVLGLDPYPARTPLNVAITGTLKRPNYTIEKIVFQSMPGLYVTGNFYLPENTEGPLPTILYLCGHSPSPYGAKLSYQDRAVWFAEHGYACLVIDTLEFAEVAWAPSRHSRSEHVVLAVAGIHTGGNGGVERHSRVGLSRDAP